MTNRMGKLFLKLPFTETSQMQNKYLQHTWFAVTTRWTSRPAEVGLWALGQWNLACLGNY